MSKLPDAVKDPITRKTHSISKEAARALQRMGDIEKKKQEDVIAISKALLNKRYSGKTNDLEVAIKFNQEGQVDQYKDPQWELSGALANLSPEMQKIVDDVITQTMLCVDKAQAQRLEDTKNKVKPVITEEAA